MAKVSVIIPIYKVEKFIERCARSLFEQTLDDIEYIFIDDRTPDLSLDVLKKVLLDYPERQRQVIIHTMNENSGQAIVRKWGIMHATGDYFVCCDSDDWVDCNMYKDMYETALSEKSDVVVCDYVETDGKDYCKTHKGCTNTDKMHFLSNVMLHKDAPSMCNKMFSRKAISGDVVFPGCSFAEDATLVPQLLWNCNKISYIQKGYYYYFINHASSSRAKGVDVVVSKYSAACKNVSSLVSFYEDKKTPKVIMDSLVFIKMYERDILLRLIRKKEYYKIWINTFPEINNKILFNNLIPRKFRLRFIMAFLGIYPYYCKIKGLETY